MEYCCLMQESSYIILVNFTCHSPALPPVCRKDNTDHRTRRIPLPAFLGLSVAICLFVCLLVICREVCRVVGRSRECCPVNKHKVKRHYSVCKLRAGKTI